MRRPAQVAFRAKRDRCYGGMSDRKAMSNVVPLTGADHPLFARAYREHYAALHAFVRHRVGTDTEAADIAQETYLRVLRYRDQPNLGAVKALLFRIAANLLVMRTRLARTRHVSDHVPLDDDLALVAEDPSQDRQVAGAQELERVIALIEKLPRRCREVFVLGRLQGLGRTEVAELLHMSAKTVDKHMRKALLLCRKHLGGDGT